MCVIMVTGMTAQTNPRTLYTSGNATVISLPKEFREETGIELGDQFILEETESGFQAIEVEMKVVSND